MECKFEHKLFTDLSTSQKCNIITALEGVGIRLEEVSFSGVEGSTYINTVYKIEGSENSFRFSKERIEPCLVSCVDKMFGSGKVSVDLSSC